MNEAMVIIPTLAPQFHLPSRAGYDRNRSNDQKQGVIVTSPEDLADMKFRDAAEIWIESRAVALRGRTPKFNRQMISSLNKFIGDLRVRDIQVEHIEAYQKARQENAVIVGGRTVSPWKKPAGPSCVNHETSVIQQVMKRAMVWGRVGSQYKPLAMPAFQKKKVLDEAEKLHLSKVAATNPEWEWVFSVCQLTLNTSASGVELRNLRFRDVELDATPPRMTVNGETAKNRYRGRTIPLNKAAKSSMESCMDRARKVGSVRAEDYIFPYRKGKGATSWVPTRPASDSWMKKPFAALRRAADMPWLTPHCFRHQAITELLENGTAEETVRSIAGHVSVDMMRHYSHPRMEAKMAALATLGGDQRDRQSKHSSKPRVLAYRQMPRIRRRPLVRVRAPAGRERGAGEAVAKQAEGGEGWCG
jgi:integrase